MRIKSSLPLPPNFYETRDFQKKNFRNGTSRRSRRGAETSPGRSITKTFRWRAPNVSTRVRPENELRMIRRAYPLKARRKRTPMTSLATKKGKTTTPQRLIRR
jgi:hypothetical protein